MSQDYLTRWNLTPDGAPMTTPTSRLLPVRFNGLPAMLKIATEAEEVFGGGLMAWWAGDGAARVYAHDGDALLMERAVGTQSLAEMARNGRDDDACRVICQAAARLHSPRSIPAPAMVPLTDWFRDLFPTAKTRGGIWTLCAGAARELLAYPQGNQILHGDIHHGNILDFGNRGWLAIDPKGLSGERGFDLANLFLNPDGETASAHGRLARRADIVAEAASLDRRRLLMWVLAWAGLSAAWMLGDGEVLDGEVPDGEVPDHALKVAAQAAAELQRGV